MSGRLTVGANGCVQIDVERGKKNPATYSKYIHSSKDTYASKKQGTKLAQAGFLIGL